MDQVCPFGFLIQLVNVLSEMFGYFKYVKEGL